jgi:regulator of protease activity HflC (stomatin/prohibitin superfamily)
MGWIVLTVFASILFWVGVGFWFYAKHRDENRRAQGLDAEGLLSPSWGLWGALSVVGLWTLITLGLMVHLVGQREVAIVYNFSGTIAGKRDAGTTMTAPWQHVKKENVGIQHEEFQFDPSSAAVSNDQQQIFATLAVNYQIDAENVVDLYRRVGPSWKSIIISSRVPQVFKEVTATYKTVDITQKREGLRSQTRERLTKELEPYDIKVVDVFITNLGFSDTYRTAIEAKQKQVQEAAQARARVAQIRAEKQQKIIAAEGDAQANRLRQRSLTPLLIQQYAIEKLNPNVQVIVCPPASVCIPNSGIIPNPVGP